MEISVFNTEGDILSYCHLHLIRLHIGLLFLIKLSALFVKF